MAPLRLLPIAAALLLARTAPATADRNVPQGTSVAPGPNIIGFPTRPGPLRRLHRRLGQRASLQVEGAYLGTAQPTVPVAGGPASTLLGTAVEGVARASVRLGRWEPYAFAGAGVMRYRVTPPGTVVDSGESSHDDVLEAPLGGGLVLHRGPVFLDLRGTARVMSDRDVVLESTLAGPNRHYAENHQLVVTATVGIAR